MSKFDDTLITDPTDRKVARQADADWSAAHAAGDREGMAKAHRTKERVRARYGYSGGEDGSDYIPLKGESASPRSTVKLPEREKFTYDYTADPAYEQYAEAYTRAGEKAMEDTLGRLSARTGGLASSYAATAAQQSYDGYMAQLADKVPQLRQLAYEMYADGLDRDREELELLRDMEREDYDRARAERKDQRAAREADRAFDRAVLESDRDFARDVLESDRDYAYRTAAREDKGSTAAAATATSSSKGSKTPAADWSGAEQAYRRYGQEGAEDWLGEHYKDLGYSTLSMARSAFHNHMRRRALANPGRTDLGWDEDEGIFTWNGKQYTDPARLLADLGAAGLDPWERELLEERLAKYGVAFEE